MLGQLLFDFSLIRVHGSLPKPSARKACSETVVRLPFARGASILGPLSTRVCRHPQTPGARIPVLGVTHQIPRSFSSSVSVAAEVPGRFTASELTMEEYHRISDKTMDILLAYLEEIVYSESSGENGWEVDYNSGVMTINFGQAHGTYVINKQPPNKQIWLSSPISGPKRYDYDASAETWFYSRDGTSLGELLTQEFQTILAGDVDVPLR